MSFSNVMCVCTIANPLWFHSQTFSNFVIPFILFIGLMTTFFWPFRGNQSKCTQIFLLSHTLAVIAVCFSHHAHTFSNDCREGKKSLNVRLVFAVFLMTLSLIYRLFGHKYKVLQTHARNVLFAFLLVAMYALRCCHQRFTIISTRWAFTCTPFVYLKH